MNVHSFEICAVASDVDKARVTLDGEEREEGADTSSKPHPQNPLQLPPPLFQLQKEAGDAVFRQRVYISVLV
jgi:hypothetical protein